MTLILSTMVVLSMFGFKSSPEPRELIDKKISDYSRILKNTNGLTLTGIGGGIRDEKIAIFGVGYEICKDVQINEARKNIVNLIEFYLHKINSDPELEGLLLNNPFNPKNLELGIRYVEPNGKYSSAIAHSFTKEGKVFYSNYDPINDRLERIHQETYEEALAIVNGQKNASK